MFKTNGHREAIEWTDSKPVTVLSTTYNHASTKTVPSRNKSHTTKEVCCPTTI
jgi:hypothetical protein